MYQYTHKGYCQRRKLQKVMRLANRIAFWLPIRANLALKIAWKVSTYLNTNKPLESRL